MIKNFVLIFLLSCTFHFAFGQRGSFRGMVFDNSSSKPIAYATVTIDGSTLGAMTDEEGLFIIPDLPLGVSNVVITSIGYDSLVAPVKIGKGINHQNFYLKPTDVNLGEVLISAAKSKAKTEVQVSRIAITPKEIKSLPSAGGDGDIAQFLTIVPGIVSTGDQGGQIYIRGGSPVQNKILLDGMTIFNPFHSIGLFSVFETEIVRSADVLSGGFNAAYSGRISAMVDIKTREGNRKQLGGLVSVNPFQTRALIEGPLFKSKNGNPATTSFILTGKKSLIGQTSKSLYSYINDSIGLPYDYTDLFGKISVMSETGSKFNVIGFNFKDEVKFGEISTLGWKNSGGSVNFSVLTPGSNFIIGGLLSYSSYEVNLAEKNRDPRSSEIKPYNLQLDFTYFGKASEFKYGIEVNGFRTAFQFKNNVGITIEQFDNNTEIGGFLKYKYKSPKFLVEPSVRLQYFASLGTFKMEPRLGLKYNVSDNFRLKAAGGYYNQNLISTVNERDIVNLFVGFLSGPTEKIFLPNSNEATKNKLQSAYHIVGGFEYDLFDNCNINVEAYQKTFTQLINLNRNKTTALEPNYVTETGVAKGIDFLLKYVQKNYNVWAGYSLSYVDRNDGEQVYPTIFDRRHNVNLMFTYQLGQRNPWEFSARFNFGTGFPFTQAKGFFNKFDFTEGVGTNPIVENQQIGVLYSDVRNGGRLPDFARFDVAVKKTIEFRKNLKLEAHASATNILDRQNIFYFDRINYTRINQLPFLPSVGLTLFF